MPWVLSIEALTFAFPSTSLSPILEILFPIANDNETPRTPSWLCRCCRWLHKRHIDAC